MSNFSALLDVGEAYKIGTKMLLRYIFIFAGNLNGLPGNCKVKDQEGNSSFQEHFIMVDLKLAKQQKK